MYNNIFYKIIVIATTFVIGGCSMSTVRYTPYDFCLHPVNSNMARIIVTRKTVSWINSNSWAWSIYDNEQPIGAVGKDDKLCWDRYPGNAIITVSNTIINIVLGKIPHIEKTLGIDAKPGIVYNVEVFQDPIIGIRMIGSQ